MARGLFSVSNLVKERDASKNIASLFLKRIEEAIVKLEPDYKPSNYYKPSSLQCIRQMYFTRKGVEPEEEKKEASFIGICESGTDRHERIQYVLSKMKELGMEFEYIDVETYVKEKKLADIEIISKKGMETHCRHKKYNLSFLTDGIIKYIPENRYFVFEYKTEVSQKFSGREQQDILHEAQGSCYALSFGIEDVMYVYEDRNFCNKKAFNLRCEYGMQKELVIDKINTCEGYLAEDKVPPKIKNTDIDKNYQGPDSLLTGPASKVCQYCRYKKECSKWL